MTYRYHHDETTNKTNQVILVFLVLTLVSSFPAVAFVTGNNVNLAFAKKHDSTNGGSSSSGNSGGGSSSSSGTGGQTTTGGSDNSNGGGSSGASNMAPASPSLENLLQPIL